MSGTLDALLNVLEDPFVNRMPNRFSPQIKVGGWKNVQRVVAGPDDGGSAIGVGAQEHFAR